MSVKRIEFYKAPAADICELLPDAIIATSGDVGIDPDFDSDIDYPFE